MDVKEYEEQVGELEMRVDRLRALFDQYFMGIEKTTPNVQHKDVERRIAILRREQTRNTALRFRFQMLVQRYNTYQTYWQRICRQIEEGTYKRHVQRAKQRMAEQEGRARKDSGSFEVDLADLDGPMPDLDLLFDEKPPHEEEKDTVFFEPPESVPPFPRSQPPVAMPPIAPPAPVPPISAEIITPRVEVPRVAAGGRVWKKVVPGQAPAQQAQAPAPQPPPPQPAPQPPPRAQAPLPPPQAPRAQPPEPKRAPLARQDIIPETRMRELYTKYVEAKRARRESTAGITYESLAQSLRESGEKLRQKHGKSVDFEIAEKDGKTILKPVLK